MEKKKKKGNPVMTIVILIALCTFGFSAYKLGSYLLDSRKTQQAVEELAEAGVSEEKAEANYEVIREKLDPITGKTVREKSLLTVELPFTVDFTALKEKNKDITGWLYCADTKINYPVMHCANNDEYLHHRPDGTWASGGSLFIDSLYTPDLSAFNTVIYGHNMKDGSMFGTLREFRREDFYKKHPVLYYFSPYGNYMLEVVGAYNTNLDSYIYAGLQSDVAKEQFLFDIKALSEYESPVEYGPKDRYVTLSTCTYEEKNARYIVICRLQEINVTSEGEVISK